jgi:prepilin-type N-terminal cleavage/methylation domain-containing protein
MSFNRLRLRPRRTGFDQAFSLVELLVAIAVSATVISMAAILAINYMKTSNTAKWVAQTQQDVSRLSRLLKTEVNEACLVQVDSPPSTTSTPPNSPCSPTGTACSEAPGTTLYLLVPVTLADGSVTYRVISYSPRPNGTDLLRSGPPIASDGSLDTTQSDVSNVVVMDNLVVTNNLVNGNSGFTASVDSSCTTATLQVRYAVPNGGGTVTRTHVFPIGLNFTKI